MKRILVVEDDRASRETLAYLLKLEQHQVRAAANAEDAKAMLFGWEPEVALLDLRLPGMRGDDFACYLKQHSPRTRIIFMSAEFQIPPLDGLGDDTLFFHKPVTPEGLLTTLDA